MKGVSFQNGIEYKIVIEGESWMQGGSISVKLDAISRNNVAAPEVRVLLAEALDRKVKTKAANTFKVISEACSPTVPFECSFPLDLNAPVTDHLFSLYLLYGPQDASGKTTNAPETLGQLRLNILPHQHLRDLIELMGTHFRFAMKTIMAGKDETVDVKFDAPDAKEWSSLENLVLHLELTEETIEANFQFNRNQIDGAKPGLASQKVKREVMRSWNLNQMLHDFNQRLNKEVATAAIDNVIAEYRETSWLNA
jgi:hypothetical protein